MLPTRPKSPMLKQVACFPKLYFIVSNTFLSVMDNKSLCMCSLLHSSGKKKEEKDEKEETVSAHL